MNEDIRVCDDCRKGEFGFVTTEGGGWWHGKCPVCDKEADLYTFRASYIRNYQSEIAALKQELEIVTNDRNGVMKINEQHRETIANLKAQLAAAHEEAWNAARLVVDPHNPSETLELIAHKDIEWVNPLFHIWLAQKGEKDA